MSDITDHETLLQFVYQVPVGLAELRPSGEFGITNPTAVRLALQISRETLNFFEMLKDEAPEIEMMVRDFTNERGTVVEDYRVEFGLRDTSSSLPLVISFTIIQLRRNKLLLVMNDVSSSVAAEKAAREANKRLRLADRMVRDYAAMKLDKDGYILEWSLSAERLMAFQGDEVIGKSFGWLHASGKLDIKSHLKTAEVAGWITIDSVWRRNLDCSFQGSAAISVIVHDQGGMDGFFCIIRDQSEAKAIENLVGQKSDFDTQTNALSRASFESSSVRLFESWREDVRPMGLIVISLDIRKDISVGEFLEKSLNSMLKNIRNNTRKSDTVVRYDTTSFLVMCPATNISATRNTAERIRSHQERNASQATSAPCRTTISAGVTALDHEDKGFEDSIQRAMRGLEQARARGHNQVVLVHPPRRAA